MERTKYRLVFVTSTYNIGSINELYAEDLAVHLNSYNLSDLNKFKIYECRRKGFDKILDHNDVRSLLKFEAPEPVKVWSVR
jgi:hypothetical protein